VKVVLFCGGLGTRLREHSATIPKPLVNIGTRPILWHLMRYYAHFGHRDFFVCLVYRGDLIRQYFLDYNECLSNNFTMSDGGKRIELHSSDIEDWRITFVETGLHSNIAERLMQARPFLDSAGTFLANYSDALSDVCLDSVLAAHRTVKAVATLVAVPSWHSFHTVVSDSDGAVQQLGEVRDSAFMVNGGFFVLEPSIFSFIESGEELVEAPFRRLISHRSLHAYRHTGFWQQMDNLKDKIMFDRMEARGNCPWMLWKR